MGALMRATDWSNTAFGAPDRWSHGLRFAVSLILSIVVPDGHLLGFGSAPSVQ